MTDNNATPSKSAPENRATEGPFDDSEANPVRPYIDLGFTGFTFNNNIYPTVEQISRIGDLLQLVAAEAPVGAR